MSHQTLTRIKQKDFIGLGFPLVGQNVPLWCCCKIGQSFESSNFQSNQFSAFELVLKITSGFSNYPYIYTVVFVIKYNSYIFFVYLKLNPLSEPSGEGCYPCSWPVDGLGLP